MPKEKPPLVIKEIFQNIAKGADTLHKVYLFTIAAIFLVPLLVIGIVESYFELLILSGFLLMIAFWKSRNSGSWQNGLCFVGIFIFAWGLIGSIVTRIV